MNVGHRSTRLAVRPVASTLALLIFLPLLVGSRAQEKATFCLGLTATIVGTSAAETINGTAGADVIAGFEGNDTINGFDGNDVICGNPGNDTIRGGNGADRMSGGAGADPLFGEADLDTLMGDAGNDTLNGGDAEDTVSFEASTTAANANLSTGRSAGQGTDTLVLIENLTGSPLADTLTGDGLDNTLIGGSGNDRLTGGDGTDFLVGMAGSDIVDGGLGSTDIVLFSVSPVPVAVDLLSHSATGEGSDSIANVEGVVGTPGNDTLRGDEQNNLLFGIAGNDLLDGRDGPDVIAPLQATGAVNVNLGSGTATGEGIDTLVSISVAVGTALGDTLTGGVGDDVILGLAGNDAINGAGGQDVLDGGEGDDSLTGGDGQDEFIGGPGNDRFLGGAGLYDVVTYEASLSAVVASLSAGTASGEGADTISQVEKLRGSPFNDSLTGGPDNNIILGLAGNDSIVGLAGNDSLNGGVGTDSTNGGAGTDVCIDAETRTQCETSLTSATTAAVSRRPSGVLRILADLRPTVTSTPPWDGPPPGSLLRRGTFSSRIPTTPAGAVQGTGECWLRIEGEPSYFFWAEAPWDPDGLTLDTREVERWIPRLFVFDFNTNEWVPAAGDGWGDWFMTWPNREYERAFMVYATGSQWIHEATGSPIGSYRYDVPNGPFFRMAVWMEWKSASGSVLGTSYQWMWETNGTQPNGPWCHG